MNNCLNCGAVLSLGASDCARCGKSISGGDAILQPVDTLDPTDSLLGNLWSGNYTLAKTYWLFGSGGAILLGILYIALIAITRSTFVALVGLLALWGWHIFISVAIWRSAGKYTGSKVWSVLARGVVVIGALMLLRSVGQLFTA
jgi:hypothetical protein